MATTTKAKAFTAVTNPVLKINGYTSSISPTITPVKNNVSSGFASATPKVIEGLANAASPAGSFTSGSPTNYDWGNTTTKGASSVANTYAGQQKQGVDLDTTNPFGFLTNRETIQSLLDAATDAAYNYKAKEARRGLVDAENTAYANTNNAVNDIRKALAGSAATGANRGTAAATALQSLLGLGQQNNELVTTGLQNIIDVADQRAAEKAANASNAIDISNNAKNLQSNSATSVYSSDATMWSELTAALGALTSSLNTDYVNNKMNDATNAVNKAIAQIEADASKYAADKSVSAAKAGANQTLYETIKSIK